MTRDASEKQPTKGTPAEGAPTKGTPAEGAPAEGAPTEGTSIMPKKEGEREGLYAWARNAIRGLQSDTRSDTPREDRKSGYVGAVKSGAKGYYEEIDPSNRGGRGGPGGSKG